MEIAKHQFATLDGLRGVAAISVMAYHRRNWFGGDDFLGHAFLAVDFFFLLSGFVVAHAYGERLKEPGARSRFFIDRVIRLHPMLILGAVIALVVAVIDARSGKSVGMDHVPLTFVAHAIPIPAFWENTSSAFPWNIAIWSLFWELLANVVFALLAPRLTERLLIAIVVASITVMLVTSAQHGGFQVGFARDPSQLLFGFPRVCASFFLGVFIYRRNEIGEWRSRYLGLACALVLVLTFAIVPNGAAISPIYDPLVAYLLYPVLLVAAAKARTSNLRLTSFLGAVSYPLYVIHEPMLKVVGGILGKAGLSDGHPTHVEAIARLCAVVAIAFGVLKLFDEPLRKLLRRLRFATDRRLRPVG